MDVTLDRPLLDEVGAEAEGVIMALFEMVGETLRISRFSLSSCLDRSWRRKCPSTLNRVTFMLSGSTQRQERCSSMASVRVKTLILGLMPSCLDFELPL